MDVVSWAREELVDWIVPCCFFHSTDFAIPYGEWVERIGSVNPAVRIIPGADQNVNGVMGRAHAMTAEHYSGWAHQHERDWMAERDAMREVEQ